MGKNFLFLFVVSAVLSFAAGCSHHISPAAVIDTQTPVSTSTPGSGTHYRMKTMTSTDSINSSSSNLVLNYVSGVTPSSMAITGYYMGAVTMTGNATFDSYGNTASSITYNSSGVQLGSQTSTISAGRVTRINTYDQSNTLTQYTTYAYNAAGQVTETDTYNGTGVLQTKSVNQYNSAGHVTRTDSYTGATLTGYSLITYDASGYMTRTEVYSSGALFERINYTNNSSGKPVSELIYDSTNTQIGAATLTYDAMGRNLGITMSLTMTGMSTSSTTTITYDSNGNMTNVTMSMTMSGIPMSSTSIDMTYETY
jgi:hypothetical protein